MDILPTDAAVALIEQWAVWFLLVVVLIGIWYWIYRFGSNVLKMFEIFLKGILDELKEIISSITVLSQEEERTRDKHSEEHRQILSTMRSLHDEIIRWWVKK